LSDDVLERSHQMRFQPAKNSTSTGAIASGATLWGWPCNVRRCALGRASATTCPRGSATGRAAVHDERGYCDGGHPLFPKREVAHDLGIVDQRVRQSLLSRPSGRLSHLGHQFARQAYRLGHEELDHVASATRRQQLGEPGLVIAAIVSSNSEHCSKMPVTSWTKRRVTAASRAGRCARYQGSISASAAEVSSNAWDWFMGSSGRVELQ
jgi:hypothetical protein